jgi:monofunctional glycosyltransferase
MRRLAKRRLARGLALASATLLAALAVWAWAGLPARSAVRALATKNPERTRLMEQREEEARAKGRRARVEQSWVPLARVSRHLIHAVLSSEDQGFFGHEGVDWKAIEESIEKNVQKGRFARGGSTITQQLAKNLYFGTRKTLGRKALELVVTRWLEADLPKARILELYLNLIEWGDGIYGCEAGARHWYGEPASALSAGDAAGLAAMIPNPRRLNPRVNPARHERATRRVLWLMGQAGYIGRDAGHPPRAVAHGPGRLHRPRRGRPRSGAAGRDGGRGRGSGRRPGRDAGSGEPGPAARLAQALAVVP